jgi:hypothetical protein
MGHETITLIYSIGKGRTGTMLKLIVVVIAGLMPMVPAVIFFLGKRWKSERIFTRNLVVGLSGFNLIVGLMAAGVGFTAQCNGGWSGSGSSPD